MELLWGLLRRPRGLVSLWLVVLLRPLLFRLHQTVKPIKKQLGHEVSRQVHLLILTVVPLVVLIQHRQETAMSTD